MSSSSDDERRPLSPAGFDTGGGVAVLCRDPSTPTREGHVPAKPSMDGVSPLNSFDLPAEALQDRVSVLQSNVTVVIAAAMHFFRGGDLVWPQQ